MRSFQHLSYQDRLRIEVLVRAGHAVKEIAEIIQVHSSTIYRELKRGRYEHRNSDYTVEERYSPELAEESYQRNLSEKGPEIKLGKDYDLAAYIEEKIIEEKYSPEAVLGELKRKGNPFRTKICVTTLYSYIEKGVFLRLSRAYLTVTEKRKCKRIVRAKRAARGESIEKRPEEVESRETFGHWEMDTVVGQKGRSKKALLVFTERKTRKEIILLLKRHTAECVVGALNQLERTWGKLFRKVFRSITVDNGHEFSDCEGMERARRGKEKRTKIYYCHPYSSYERGSNENQNKLIRRHIKKGSNFDGISKKKVKGIEGWMNRYPRRLFGYHTAEELFAEELEKIEKA